MGGGVCLKLRTNNRDRRINQERKIWQLRSLKILLLTWRQTIRHQCQAQLRTARQQCVHPTPLWPIRYDYPRGVRIWQGKANPYLRRFCRFLHRLRRSGLTHGTMPPLKSHLPHPLLWRHNYRQRLLKFGRWAAAYHNTWWNLMQCP